MPDTFPCNDIIILSKRRALVFNDYIYLKLIRMIFINMLFCYITDRQVNQVFVDENCKSVKSGIMSIELFHFN